MLTLSPYSFDGTQLKTPTTRKLALRSRERAWSITIFIRKFLSYLGLSALFISLGLIVGIIGYHWAAGLSWLDAKGGSFDDTSVAWARLVPSQLRVLKCLLLYMHLESGLIFVLAMGIVLSPLVYSLLSQFQVSLKQDNEEEGERAAKK